MKYGNAEQAVTRHGYLCARVKVINSNVESDEIPIFDLQQ